MENSNFDTKVKNMKGRLIFISRKQIALWFCGLYFLLCAVYTTSEVFVPGAKKYGPVAVAYAESVTQTLKGKVNALFEDEK